MTIKSCTWEDEGNYFVKVGGSGKTYVVHSGSLTVTNQISRTKSILKVFYVFLNIVTNSF